MRAPNYSSVPDEILSIEAIEHPHKLYKRLREQLPVAKICNTGVHTVSNWSLIEEVLGRERDFSANLTGVLCRGSNDLPQCFELPNSSATAVIATADDPVHAVHRSILQPQFLAGKVAALEPLLRRWIVATLLPLFEAGDSDYVPAIEQIPAMTVAHLLGLPQEDLCRHRVWAMMGGDILAGEVSDTRLEFLARQTSDMAEYLSSHIDRALADTDHSATAPIVHILAQAIATGEIDRDQALGMAIVLFGAGGESTAALIGSMLHFLATDSNIMTVLREKPELSARFIEEIIRLEPPFKFHYRVVRRPCKLGGYDLATDDRLMLLWASANRDSSRFEDPDSLRLDRRHIRQHLGFGRGAHFCIGAGLARMEAKLVLETILQHIRRFECVSEKPPVYARSIFVRRFESLVLRAS